MFLSLGGVFFLAFLALGLFCLAKKKKKPVLMVPPEVCVEEHQHLREIITTDPCGDQTVTALSMMMCRFIKGVPLLPVMLMVMDIARMVQINCFIYTYICLIQLV